MAALAKEAMEAGAHGFGTSRTLNHRSSDGSPIATLTKPSEDELTGIAPSASPRRGKGVLQVVSDFFFFADEDAEFCHAVPTPGGGRRLQAGRCRSR